MCVYISNVPCCYASVMIPYTDAKKTPSGFPHWWPNGDI